MSGNTTHLEPVRSIKPNFVDETKAIKLIKDHFDYDVTEIKQLNSYDDINYYVETKSQGAGAGQKFVLKILNTLDSERPDHVEAENEVMLLLKDKGINCPIPQKTVEGKIYALIVVPPNPTNGNEDEEPKTHLIRLLSYVPGVLFYDVQLSKKLLYEAGAYIGYIDDLLKGHWNSALSSRDSIWYLQSTPDLEKFLFVYDDKPNKKKIVSDVISAFQNQVVPSYPQLEKGVIHGDFNEQNIICQRSKTTSEDVITGLIDFGDLHIGFYVFELAITMCYMMIECVRHGNKIDPLVGGGHVLAGYSKIHPVSQLELKILRVCIASRLCQSFVLGEHTYQQDPSNPYVIISSTYGWPLLERLWNETTDEQLQTIWQSVLTSKQVQY